MGNPEKLISDLAGRTLVLALLPLLVGAVCAVYVFLCPAWHGALAAGCVGVGLAATGLGLALRARFVRRAAKEAVAAEGPPLGGAEALRAIQLLRNLASEVRTAAEARAEELERAAAETGALLREAAGLHALLGEKLRAAEGVCRGAGSEAASSKLHPASASGETDKL